MVVITHSSPLWIKLPNLWWWRWEVVASLVTNFPQSVTTGLSCFRALDQKLQMGAPLYRSPVGDITLLRCAGLMMKANISILAHIYQINFIFTDPPQGYWHIDGLQAKGRRREWGERWPRDSKRVGMGEEGEGQEGLMVFTIFNAEGCHHWISILNNVAFHHKFFTTYLLNGKSYGLLSGR